MRARRAGRSRWQDVCGESMNAARRGPGRGPCASASFHTQPVTVVTRPHPTTTPAAHASMATAWLCSKCDLKRVPAAPSVKRESVSARPGPPKVDGVPWKGQTPHAPPAGRHRHGNQYAKPSSDRKKAEQSLRSETSRSPRPRPAVLQATCGVTHAAWRVSRPWCLHRVKPRA